MKEVIRIDWYTKFILTVIALALCWLSVKPLFTAKEVIANPGTIDVNIVEVGGIFCGSKLPVKVTNWP